jgi:hypothetical protein
LREYFAFLFILRATIPLVSLYLMDQGLSTELALWLSFLGIILFCFGKLFQIIALSVSWPFKIRLFIDRSGDILDRLGFWYTFIFPACVAIYWANQ